MAVTARLTEPCNVMITPEMRAQLDEEATQRGVALAAVVRDRLERDLQEHPVDSVAVAR